MELKQHQTEHCPLCQEAFALAAGLIGNFGPAGSIHILISALAVVIVNVDDPEVALAETQSKLARMTDPANIRDTWQDKRPDA